MAHPAGPFGETPKVVHVVHARTGLLIEQGARGPARIRIARKVGAPGCLRTTDAFDVLYLERVMTSRSIGSISISADWAMKSTAM